MARILFQGDSITDGGRGRGTDPNHTVGHSYPYPIASGLGAAYPAAGLEFLNRGCSGDTVCDLYARWQGDTLSLRPDVVSILIGVNDAFYRMEVPEGCYSNVYLQTYRLLLQRCREVNPEMQFIILEPFMLDIGNQERFADFFGYVREFAGAAKQVAREFGAVFVPLQERFEEACKRAPADYWIWDSIHPTYNGHGLIAQAFLEDTKPLFDKLV